MNVAADSLKLPPDIQEMYDAENEADEPRRAAVLRNPATVVRLETIDDYKRAINEYFEWCFDRDVQPRIASLALALGLPGISSIHRLARRNPELREIISRAVTAISAWYEEGLSTSASKGAIFALTHLGDFDLEEDPHAPEVHFWNEKPKNLIVENRIVGIKSLEDQGSQYSPQEAYMKLVQGETIVEISQDEMKAQRDDEPRKRPTDIEEADIVKDVSAHSLITSYVEATETPIEKILQGKLRDHDEIPD